MQAHSGNNYLPVREDWLAQRREDILEPQLPIVDAHHHFYDRPGWTYLADEYLTDARSGHHITASVYMQAQTRYRTDGPDAYKPVGETAFVAAVAAQQTQTQGPAQAADQNSSLNAVSSHYPPNINGNEKILHSDYSQNEATNQALGGPRLAGIVGHANLTLGAEVRGVLEAHLQAGQGLFKGIRHLTTWDADSSLTNPLSAVPQGLLLDPAYRAGVAQLSDLGLSYDAWLLFPQLPELFDLAKSVPGTPVVVNHCGGVVRIAGYRHKPQQVFDTWARSMRELATLPNVLVKLERVMNFDARGSRRR